ncbi:DUF1653 domain-containing protein [Anoxybacterium hadale]|uniref:DUF1653 domain-containing protein n=1 Tax=Anoxybacterium hadale TaxID=3408580 RepID=A0ACD1AH91_9FIRM|nr:DUF1653 domain-containing protein [Clostridiales bacterium]
MPDIKPGLYRHFKGNQYRVLSLGRHSETLEPMVVYQALYGDYGVWVRPAYMWNEVVEHEGRRIPRFESILKETAGERITAPMGEVKKSEK